MLLIEKFDFFGAEYRHNIFKQGPAFKSIIGGVVTVLTGILLLIFMSYKLTLWVNNELTPNIVSYSQIQNELLIQYDLEIVLKDVNFLFDKIGVQSDPFDQSKVILIPTIILLDANLNLISQKILLNQAQNNSIKIQNITLSAANSSSQPYIMIIQFEKCITSKLINTSYICASDDDISNFLSNNQLMLQAIINTQQLNSISREFQTVYKSFENCIIPGFTQFSKFNLQTTEFQLVSQYESLFQDDYQKLTSIDFQTSLIKDVSSTKLSAMVFYVDSSQTVQVIQFVQLSNVLSQIGSISFFILLLKQIVFLLNKSNLELALINEIIGYYYPKFKYIKVNRNLLGRITQVKCNYQNLNKTEFINFYEKAKKVALQKMSITNQLYELSRLQFVTQSLQSRKSINQSHRIGIPLVIAEEVDYSKVLPMDDSNFMDHKIENQLSDEDFTLLTEFNSNIPKGNNKFYDINQLFQESS